MKHDKYMIQKVSNECVRLTIGKNYTNANGEEKVDVADILEGPPRFIMRYLLNQVIPNSDLKIRKVTKRKKLDEKL